uniref:Uncharacterized protein n=1 Tax=Romanomermis culicivorax TaxID=13658 RepID=A0A915LAA6_ROMCU
MDCKELGTFSLEIHFRSERITVILREMTDRKLLPKISLPFGSVLSIAFRSVPSEKANVFDTPVGLSIEGGRFFVQCTRYGAGVTLNVTAESRQRPGEFFYPNVELKLDPDVVRFWVKVDDLAGADSDYFCQNVEEDGRRGESSAERGFGSQECQNSPPCQPGTYCVKRQQSSKAVEYCLRGKDIEDRCQQTIPPKEDVLYVACKGGRSTTLCHHQVHGLVSSLEHGTFCADESDTHALVTIGNPKTTTGDILRLVYHTPISVSINCTIKNRLES